ncbi:hypothetical protein [Aeromonas veronii]|uniref:Uncharacterized protein n=1 Tax=Aeromonas veronii TaxID=654 RepID=A0A2T4MX58_AERVE|nr:hypothetical protein [Aeromonas veronii]PTH79188.1 hypothetical protein DAA48_22415 [Aeromonas veronii]
MFNLIISIIAIALVVVLAGASLYYGGDAFNKGSEEAKASTYINQAQQLQASATLFKASNGGLPSDASATKNVQSLIDGKYLAGQPKVATGTGAWGLDSTNGVILVEQDVTDSAKTGMTLNICDTINDNGAGVVFCSASKADVASTIDTVANAPLDMDDTTAATAAKAVKKITVFMKL